MKASHTIRPVFDDPNLVSAAGLVPAMVLAESAGLHDLLAERVSVTSPNAAWGVTLLVDSRYQEGTTRRDVIDTQEVHPGVQG